MRQQILVLVALLLAACSASTTGAYLPDRYDSAARSIAHDAASKLALEYPPDDHALELVAQTQTTFDRAFASSLRRSGFPMGLPSGDERERIVVQYAVDQIRGTKLVRVTMFVDHRTLSRAYAPKPGGVYPAGPWSSGVHHGG